MHSQIDTNLGTHGSYKALLARGFNEEQAEGIIEVLNVSGSSYITSSDLEREIARARTEIKESETRLTKLIYVNTFTIIGVMLGIVSAATAIIKLF